MVCVSHTWDIPFAAFPPFPRPCCPQGWLCQELQGATEMSLSSQAALPPTPGLAYKQGMEERPQCPLGWVEGAMSQGAQSSTDLGLWSRMLSCPTGINQSSL